MLDNRDIGIVFACLLLAGIVLWAATKTLEANCVSLFGNHFCGVSITNK